jgi:hypothetical protein
MRQLSFAEIEIESTRKPSRVLTKLEKIDKLLYRSGNNIEY